MAVRMTFDTQEAAPEEIRDHLVEHDGKFVFEAEPTGDVAGLKSALVKERTARAELEKQMAAFKGVDPDEYRKLRGEREKAKLQKLSEEGDVDALVKERVKRAQEAWDAEKAELARTLTEQNAHLDRLLIDNEVVRILEAPTSRIRAKEGALDDIMLNLRRQDAGWKLQRVKGDVVVTDENGTVQYGKDPSKPLGIADLLGDLAAAKPHLFVQSSGAGISNERAGGRPPRKKISEMSGFEKSALMKEVGEEEFGRLILAEQKQLRAVK